MESDNQSGADRPGRLRGRIIGAGSLALAIALSAYLVINLSSATNFAFASFWFLAILPAYLCALICYVGDPDRTMPSSFYWQVPPVFVAIILAGSVIFLREGIICLVMLAPIWMVFGWFGAFALRHSRKGSVDPRRMHASLLFLPLMGGAVESAIPIPHDLVSLDRAVVIHARPAEIWPFAVANAHIRPDEGRWTFSQSVLGLPRPRATVMHGAGLGAVRTAYWGDKIDFDEDITQWQPSRRLGWTFSFANSSLQDFTDKHIAPDGQFLKIDSGDYTLTPLGGDATLLTLRTRYIAKTHVNFYAELWGEILLGDIESNVLAVIKQRAEAAHRTAHCSAPGRPAPC